MSVRPSILLADANVLIDYRDVDPSILALAVKHIGPVFVLRDVLDEVRDFDETTAASLGMTVVDTSAELMLEISSLPRRLTRADRLCYLACRDSDWVCLTNDRFLRSHCEANSLRTSWGLELLIKLHGCGVLPPERAIEIARSIASGNRSIAAVLDRFLQALP